MISLGAVVYLGLVLCLIALLYYLLVGVFAEGRPRQLWLIFCVLLGALVVLNSIGVIGVGPHGLLVR